jgi:phosphosulfolactate synthase (CoM biosynthesis protein A)
MLSIFRNSSLALQATNRIKPAFAANQNKTFTTAKALLQPTNAQIMLEDKEGGYGFIRHNPLQPKPRTKAVTEIRGPYYTVMGSRYLSDVLETMGAHVDGLKFAGGSFSLMPQDKLREIIDLAHQYGVYVSTGGWMEHVLASSGGADATVVDKYIAKCKDVGFDVIEISTGFLSLPGDDWLRLVDRVHQAGLKAKPELGIQFGAGGDTSTEELSNIGTSDPSRVVNIAKKFVDAGVERMMIESEGITENVQSWRTDVIQTILKELPMDKVMFEAADPAVFNWYVHLLGPSVKLITNGNRYIREFGVDVNLFVDHSQIVQLAGLRAGIWGKSDTFGKIATFRP